jgi:hypothetical protein
LDANWSGGLGLARKKYGSRKNVTLIAAESPDDFDQFSGGEFKVAAALETLQHGEREPYWVAWGRKV